MLRELESLRNLGEVTGITSKMSAPPSGFKKVVNYKKLQIKILQFLSRNLITVWVYEIIGTVRVCSSPHLIGLSRSCAQ
jgi:hypothetical protein